MGEQRGGAVFALRDGGGSQGVGVELWVLDGPGGLGLRGGVAAAVAAAVEEGVQGCLGFLLGVVGC